MTKEELDNLVDQRIPVGVRKGVTASNLRLTLHDIIQFIVDIIKVFVGGEVSYPTDEINSTHVGRLFYLDEEGKGRLTQKEGGSEQVNAILKWSCQDTDSCALPTHPIFRLQINTNFADGETIQLPHPNSSVDLDTVFTAKTTVANPEDFEIGATIQDSRDNLMALIQSLWSVTGKNEISCTADGTDSILIEILSTSNNYQGGFEFFMPSEFNGIENDIITDADITYTLEQSGVDGFLTEAFVLSGTWQVDQSAKCYLQHDGNDMINIYPVHLIHKDHIAGVEKWGFNFPQSGNEIMENLRGALTGVAGGDTNISSVCSVSIVQVDGSEVFITAEQTDSNIFTSTITAQNQLTFPISSVVQQVIPASISFVKRQVVGFVSAVISGRVYASKAYLNHGVLLDGSNTLPAPEMGDYAHFKMVLMPSNDGKLENVINWGSSLETPPPDIAAAMYLNGAYIAVEEKSSGLVLVKPMQQ